MKSQSFAEYIDVLKLLRNAGVRNVNILLPAYYAYFEFLETPELFKKNLHELFEVDALHQQMDEQYGSEIIAASEFAGSLINR